jgi:hypothetical protein
MTRREVLAGIGALPLRAAESKAERAERVVREALEALGGDRFLSMNDRVESGRAYSFFRERLSGLSITTVYTRYLVRPDPPVAGFFGLRMRQGLGKKQDISVIFREDGKGWEVTYRGAKPIPQPEVLRFQDGQLRSVLYILRMRLGEPGLIIESQGRDVMDNQPVEVVDFTDAENRVVRVFFQESTKLPIRQSSVRGVGADRFEEVTVFAKYRDVGGGVQWPFTLKRERDKETVFEMFLDSASINQDLDDTLFTLMGKTKELPAK